MSKKNKNNSKIYNPYAQQSYILLDDVQPNPDRLFENASVDFEKYLDLQYLDVVAKCEVAAKSFAKKFPSSIEQGDSSDEVFEYIQGLWNGTESGLDLKQSQDDILEYILPGFSVTQLIQGLDSNGRKTIVKTVTQPQNYFVFTNKGELKPSDCIIGTKPLDTDLEFLVARDKLTGGNFYGIGVAKSIYYDSQILKDLNKFVHQTSSKSAVPPVVVINKPAGSNQTNATENATKTSIAFEKLRSGSAISIGHVQDIKELKGGDPQKLVDVVRTYESKVCERYIGNADLIQHFDGGSYAKLTELTGIVRTFAEPRNLILEAAMNELIYRVVRVTFGKDIKAPRLVYDRKEKPDAKLVLEYYDAGIAIKTESMPSFVGEKDEIVKKDLSTSTPGPDSANLSDNTKKKNFQSEPKLDDLNKIAKKDDKFLTDSTEIFLEEFEKTNLEIFEKNLKKDKLPAEDKYINSQYKTMLDFLVLSYAIGRFTVYRQIKKETPKTEFTFADIIIQVGSETLTVNEMISSLEGLMNLEDGSIYETVLNEGGEELSKAIYGKSYKVFVEKINKKLFESEIVSYSEWLQSLASEGINLNAAIGNTGYWQTVYETNMSSLYSYGRQVETQRLKEFIEFEQYNAILDGVTTPICQDLDDKIKKVGTWGAFYPPNHYNCRSIVNIITKFRAKSEGLKANRFDLRKQKFPDKNFNRVFNIKALTKELKKL